MSQMIPFEFEGRNVRVVTGEDGEPWFVGKDVALLLGYSNPQKALRDHCKALIPVGVNESFTLDPQTKIIPERDVYRLIMRSKLPSAEKFEDWVVGEVLPSIRKTGSYDINKRPSHPALPDFTNPVEAARAWADQYEARELAETRVLEQSKKIEEDAPKVEYYNGVADCEGLLTVSEAIKQMNLGVGRNTAFTRMREMGILQSTESNWNLPFQRFVNQGYFRVKQKILPNKKVQSVTLLTPKGHQWLFKKLV